MRINVGGRGRMNEFCPDSFSSALYKPRCDSEFENCDIDRALTYLRLVTPGSNYSGSLSFGFLLYKKKSNKRIILDLED